jgi:uncharacterized protein (DUF1800 family)
MAFDAQILPPDQAWTPLRPDQWDAECARHLLRRTGFTAQPAQVERAYSQGLTVTLDEAFGRIRPMPQPRALVNYAATRAQYVADLRTAANDEEKTRQIGLTFNAQRRQDCRDATLEWLTFARDPANSAQEKLVQWLANILVVSFYKVNDPERLFAHSTLLRQSWQKRYPEICQAVTRSPAMIEYLDLASNHRDGPNENYARELMELFTLGEGNYTEKDVKEAARALTGVVIKTGYATTREQGDFVLDQWDFGPKTIFGKTGPWQPDDVIDLIFTQPSARTHLPGRFLTEYLAEDPLPAPYLAALGNLWVQHDWRVDELAKIVFSSKLFYDPRFRGNLIKSPIHFYVGLCQDLNLEVFPNQSQLLPGFEAMGQQPFMPNNVRGWIGGRSWINSTTLDARCRLVEQLFTPVKETALDDDPNAMMSMSTARSPARGTAYVTPERLRSIAALSDPELADHLLGFFLPGPPDPAYRAAILDYLQNTTGSRPDLVKDVTVALLQSPLYQLC